MAENVYAPMDLFDWLSIIGKLKEEGLTLKEIGNKIGQSESWIKLYSAVLKNISLGILEFCKKYQTGRQTEKVSSQTFEFTQDWFYTSGLYNLSEKYQLKTLFKNLRSNLRT